MSGCYDPFAEPTDEARATYAKWKPVADAAEAAWHKWLVANLLPGERSDQARARYSAIQKEKRDRVYLALSASRARLSVRRQPGACPIWSAPRNAADAERQDAIDRSARLLIKDD